MAFGDVSASSVSEYAGLGFQAFFSYFSLHLNPVTMAAFIFAGFLLSVLPRGIFNRFLGPKANPWISYPIASIAGFFISVCSCSILPMFISIKAAGAGLGPAFTFLYVGPAINVMAITLTLEQIGLSFALGRLIASIIFGIAIGAISQAVEGLHVRRAAAREGAPAPAVQAADVDEREAGSTTGSGASGAGASVVAAAPEEFVDLPPVDLTDTGSRVSWQQLVALLLVFLMIILTSLPFSWYLTPLFSFRVPLAGLVEFLARDDVTLVGLVLLALQVPTLVLYFVIHRDIGLELHIVRPPNARERAAIILTLVQMAIATLQNSVGSDEIVFSVKTLVSLLAIGAFAVFVRTAFPASTHFVWMREHIAQFGKIVPTLLFGVFLTGIFAAAVPETWVASVLGDSALWRCIVAVVFGVILYLPTLVEVPVARMFLDMGAHRGPLLSYLLADPVLSLQQLLVLARHLTPLQLVLFVGLTSVFCTLGGWLYGLASDAWSDN